MGEGGGMKIATAYATLFAFLAFLAVFAPWGQAQKSTLYMVMWHPRR